MKKLAGRDFKDILQVGPPSPLLLNLVTEMQPLQCWIPILEGILLGEHNEILLNLTFNMATWQAYSKLHMYISHTIKSLWSQTKELGCQLHCYANRVCSKYKTKPLPGEAAAACRQRVKKKTAADPQQPNASNVKSTTSKATNVKQFNLKTYKIHALGDYADHIELFGPTDCFSTQQVCFVASQFSPPQY